jgi:hypothetical protein
MDQDFSRVTPKMCGIRELLLKEKGFIPVDAKFVSPDIMPIHAELGT